MANDLLRPTRSWVPPGQPQRPRQPAGVQGLGSRGPARTGIWGRSGTGPGNITTREPEGGYRPLTPGPVGAGNIGGGGSSGGAPPPGWGGGGFNTNVEANPYLAKAFGYFEELWNKSKALEGETYNKDPAIQDYQDTRAQGYKEAQAMAGGRGFGPGTGMSMAQMQRYGDTTNRGEQELAGNLWNAGLNQRTQLLQNMAGILSGMGGVGGNLANNQLGLINAATAQAAQQAEAMYKMSMLPIEMERARVGLMNNQISAMSQIAGML